MTDKAKYASHGVFIQKINQNFLGKWDKPKNAVIHPIPTTKPRQKPSSEQQQQKMKLNSNTFKAGFRFQQPINQKPVSQDLIQPFLYIEKVIQKHQPKKKVQPNTKQIMKTIIQKDDKEKDKEKDNKDNKQNKKRKQTQPKLKPFITSTIVKNNSKTQSRPASAAPTGYSNLFQYQLDKKNTANLIFQKMLQSEVQNVKDLFNLWNKNAKRNLGQDINIKQQQFVNFVKELVSGKVTTATIKHFFQLYRTNTARKILAPSQFHGQEHENTGQISISAFAYNYTKYKKAQTQITNIMSQKFARERYTDLKKYVADFLSYYPELKQGTKAMKQYEQTLRQHFKRLYEGYQNPFETQINQLKTQLQKPIIKYDKDKRQKIQKKIQQYQLQNSKIYSKLTRDYHHFMQSYQDAIVKNHDLLFTKRTVAYLLWPILQRQPLLTRDLIQQQVGVRQQQKQRYLQCLSDIVVEIDNDKKHLVQDCFTLGDLVQLVKMKFRNKKSKYDQQLESFTIQSLKKLIKQIKRQFLVKNNLIADDLNNFPADQQISLEVLHTCFEMQCTKVLFKNKIWSELLQMLPQRSIQSKLHQKTIDANTCMEYLKKYFRKLDERSNLQRNKAKQVSLLVQNAYNQNFGKYADVIDNIIMGLDGFVQGIEDKQDQNQNLTIKKKKVAFGDVVESKLAVDRGQKNLLDPSQQQSLQIARDVIKMIHLGAQGIQPKEQPMTININKVFQTNKSAWIPNQPQRQASPYQNLHMIKSMAKSYFQPQAMNTNAFDIRFYQKMAEQQKQAPQKQLIQLGISMILSGAPWPQQIEGQKQDPLKISRFLLKTIDKDIKQKQQFVNNKQYQKDIKQGVSHNYYKQKIKLQNKPTRYDSEGKGKYSVLLPVGYYESYIVGQSVPDQQKWYLRPHHVETLTQNPLSKKDNVINTQYQSKLEKLGLKKRPDQYVIEQNVKRKQGLISQLEDRVHVLKKQINNARRPKDIQGHKVKPAILDNYYNKIQQGKQDKQLQFAVCEGVLYDLRRKQRQLLNKCRQKQTTQRGQPKQRWWQKKDKQFNRQAKKQRQLLVDNSGVHKSYVNKLKNNQIY